MPQMAPLNWLTLFIAFNLIFMIYLNKVWFNKMSDISNEINFSFIKTNFNSMMWKW